MTPFYAAIPGNTKELSRTAEETCQKEAIKHMGGRRPWDRGDGENFNSWFLARDDTSRHVAPARPSSIHLTTKFLTHYARSRIAFEREATRRGWSSR